ncbi:hypothetical protein IMZ31_18905 (plasmid) [Pontibacillus sp. ALD_SL1]|uniref:hypothetical protein n=1 Tax=Pontibacillus sp. ALD_SL1 TaxID=2777185 RepID=UPI001A9713F5|nr:hypothetical protein [Pontibacillus sp. ALD_SL1]QST02619.1 hypothetical protein IMZ31_18905 [Pontibacillus sp. ALD_SL1]
METMEEWIQEQIDEGYMRAGDLEPIKCQWCESSDLEDRNHGYENLGIVSKEKWCNACEKRVNTWSYGSWDL